MFNAQCVIYNAQCIIHNVQLIHNYFKCFVANNNNVNVLF